MITFQKDVRVVNKKEHPDGSVVSGKDERPSVGEQEREAKRTRMVNKKEKKGAPGW